MAMNQNQPKSRARSRPRPARARTPRSFGPAKMAKAARPSSTGALGGQRRECNPYRLRGAFSRRAGAQLEGVLLAREGVTLLQVKAVRRVRHEGDLGPLRTVHDKRRAIGPKREPGVTQSRRQ